MIGDENRKICIISPGLGLGGVERATVNFAEGLAKLNYQVTILCIFLHPHFYTIHGDIKVIEPNSFNSSRINIFKTLRYLRNIIKTEKPVAILSMTKLYGSLSLIALAGTNYRIFISERSSPFYRWPFYQRIIGVIARKIKAPEGIISQTKLAAEVHKKTYGKKVRIRVIPNPLREVKTYSETKREEIILAVGRFGDSSKGFDLLLKAFYLANLKTWTLVFAGNHDKGDDLFHLAKNLGILNRIVFLGSVKNIDYQYARAGIFVIPSRSEGFPNVLCEAMAAGVPCISFDFHTGPRDIISDGIDGVIVKNGDIIGLAEAIKHLAANVELRVKLGESAKAISSKLDPNRVCSDLADFIFQKNNE